MASLRKTIAIDLGTAQVLVYVAGRGIVLEEPSVIAVDILTDEILAVGSEAKKLIGRTPGNVKAIMPMKDGVISDFRATERMLKYFLDKSIKKSLFKPDILICVPSRSTQVEKRAVLQAADNAGAHRTYLMEEPLAAALGAGVDITDVGGNLVIDIGGGTTDIAVVSMGQVVASRSVDVAGLSFDRKIKDYIRKRYGILIGDQKSEEIKIEAGLAGLDQSLEVSGRAIVGGLPQKIFLPVAEIHDCVRTEIDKILEGVKKVLEVTPPELASDIYEREIILTGGGANTLGLRERIAEKLQIPVKIADDPSECVIIGTSKALNWMESLDEEKNHAIKGKQKELEREEKLRRR
ncbi:rod shape-determining protein [uncultured Anaerococcus sp.]|uniref:rod shape-determining protein n=1 Tax=uncultured Anaerococcus sp. TaxID=293428 RepID=UPI00262381D5|nr:rod shape-determining protein [uncultured Anaerococcus sp.]